MTYFEMLIFGINIQKNHMMILTNDHFSYYFENKLKQLCFTLQTCYEYMYRLEKLFLQLFKKETENFCRLLPLCFNNTELIFFLIQQQLSEKYIVVLPFYYLNSSIVPIVKLSMVIKVKEI